MWCAPNTQANLERESKFLANLRFSLGPHSLFVLFFIINIAIHFNLAITLYSQCVKKIKLFLSIHTK